MPDLILGTATFGSAYGIANQGFNVEHENLKEILDYAQNNGISEFDTAPTYGNAENLLGKFLDQRQKPKISSKINQKDCFSVDNMLKQIQKTLTLTKASQIKNLYLHDPEPYNKIKFQIIREGFLEALNRGLTEHVGASVYSLNSLLHMKEQCPEMSVFQVPENVCDRRLLYSKELMELSSNGNKLNVRSIFLQGLLLMEAERIQSEFPTGIESISKLIKYGNENNIRILDICLGYARLIPWADGIVFGVVSINQLKEIITSSFKLPDNWESQIIPLPENLLDPRRWKNK